MNALTCLAAISEALTAVTGLVAAHPLLTTESITLDNRTVRVSAADAAEFTAWGHALDAATFTAWRRTDDGAPRVVLILHAAVAGIDVTVVGDAVHLDGVDSTHRAFPLAHLTTSVTEAAA